MFNINELALKIKNGDEEEIATLYKEVVDSGIRIARQHARTNEDAEDAFQEAFLKAISNIDKWDEARDFKPWFDVIVVNTSKNIAARKDNSAVVSFSAMNSEDDPDSAEFEDSLASSDLDSNPEAVMDMQALKDIMNEILSELPDAQRQTVFLYYYKDMSVKEIAQLQNVSEDTVKSRLNYSRKKVKVSIEEYEKKHGIRLHSIAIAPLLLLFFKKDARAAQMAGLSATGAASTSAATATATIASAAGVSTAVKIAIGAAVVILGTSIGIGITVSHREKPKQNVDETIEEKVVEDNSAEEYIYTGTSAQEKINALGEIPVRDFEAGGFSLRIGDTSLGQAKEFYSDNSYEEQLLGVVAATGYVGLDDSALFEEGIYDSYFNTDEYAKYASYLDKQGEFRLVYSATELAIPKDNRYTLYLYFMDLEGGTMDPKDRILMDARIEYEENAEHMPEDFALGNGFGTTTPCSEWAYMAPEMCDFDAGWGYLSNNDTFMVAINPEFDDISWETSFPSVIEVGFGPFGRYESSVWRIKLCKDPTGEILLGIVEKADPRGFGGGLTDDMFDDSVTFPEGVYKLRPDETYEAMKITNIEEYIDPNTSKKYYLITFDKFSIHSISKEFIGDYINVTIMFDGDVTFYYEDDDGNYIYDASEVLTGGLIDRMRGLTIEYPDNPTFGKGEERQVKFKWNGVGTRIRSAQHFL